MKKIIRISKEKRVNLFYEATVGAGLPVIDTVDKFQESGDQIELSLGCLSGSIGYILTQVEDGMPFSQAVEKARALGYTEPDPRDDLSGMDVARKTLILARRIGSRINLEDIEVDCLYSQDSATGTVATFIKNLESNDKIIEEKVNRAKRNNKVLRYVARIHGNEASVKLEEVERDSPLGRLRGLDNQITITSKRYSFHPLSIIGPGAGAEVTASGVLSDIQKIVRNCIGK